MASLDALTITVRRRWWLLPVIRTVVWPLALLSTVRPRVADKALNWVLLKGHYVDDSQR